MNCSCNIPAITKISQKIGPNYGKAYFSCSNRQQCGFFCWVNSSMPISTFAQSKYTNNNNNKYSNNNQSSNVDTSNKICVSLKLTEFEDTNPPRIWFSTVHGYSKDLDAYYSTIPSDMKKYDNNKKMWLFDMAIYENYINELHSSKFSDKVYVNDIPKFLTNGLKKYITKLSKPVDMTLNIEESLYDTLLPFQVEGVNFIIKRHGRGLIGDEMGVGKTVQAIALLQHYRKHWPALILVPSSLMQQWNDELLLYSGDILKQKDICQVKKGSDKVSGKVCLVSYNLMDKLSNKESLSYSQFGIVIADESHNLKNKDAVRTSVCLPYLKNAAIAICLTGTPALNRPVELYTQLNGILPEVFNDYDAFTKRYCDAKPSNFGKNAIDVKGSSNEAELKLLLEGAVMIRRLKDVVLKDRLPSKQREVRYCNIDPLYENEMKEIHKRSSVLDKIINDHNTDHARKQSAISEKQALMTNLYGVTGRSKIQAIIKELAILIEENRKWLKSNEVKTSNDNKVVVLEDVDDNNFKESKTVFDLSNLQDDDEQEKKIDTVVDLTSSNRGHDLNSSKNKTKRGKVCNDPSAVVMTLEDDDILFDTIPTDEEDNDMGIVGKSIKVVDDDDDNLVDSDDDMNTQNRMKMSKRLVKTKDLLQSSTKVKANTLKSSHLTSSADELAFLGSPLLKSKSKKKNMDYINDHWNDLDDDNDDDDDDDDIFFDNRYTKVAKKVKKKRKLSNEQTNDEDSDDFIACEDTKQSNKDSWKNILNGGSNKKKKKKNYCDESSPIKYSGIGKKILMFAHHQDVLDGIEDYLRESRVGYIRIDGKTDMKHRSNAVKKFQQDDLTEVALLSITACGTGLNLTRASIVFFGELNWTPGVMLQAESRIHRLGQKSKDCRVVYLLARKTADDTMWEALNSKIDVLDSTVGMADNSGYGMTINTKKGDYHDSTQTTLTFTRGISQLSQPMMQEKEIEIMPALTRNDQILSSKSNFLDINEKDPNVTIAPCYAKIETPSKYQNQNPVVIPAVNIYNNTKQNGNSDIRPYNANKSLYGCDNASEGFSNNHDIKIATDENLDNNFYYDFPSQISTTSTGQKTAETKLTLNPNAPSDTKLNSEIAASTMTSTISPERKARIEANRIRALEIKAKLKLQMNGSYERIQQQPAPIQQAMTNHKQIINEEPCFTFKTAGNSNPINISNVQMGKVDKFFEATSIPTAQQNQKIKPKNLSINN